MSPFIELNDMGFCGLMRLNVTSTRPFSACAMAFPEMLFNVTVPLMSSTSISPSTPETTMLPSFTVRRISEVRAGTLMVRSIGRW